MLAIDGLKALADESRLRLLLTLQKNDLNVQELTQILGLSQSTISHHLRTLRAAGLVSSRNEGTWSYFSLLKQDENPQHHRLVLDIFEMAAGDKEFSKNAAGDLKALNKVLAQRRDQSRKFFDGVADQWNEIRDRAHFGSSFLETLSERIPKKGTFLELGCGSGSLLRLITPRQDKSIAVDFSEEMLNTARIELGKNSRSVDLRLGYLEHLPVSDNSIDTAACCMVLHHISDPKEVIKDAFRVLKPKGELLVLDLRSHKKDYMREKFSDLWMGFKPEEFRGWLKSAGFKIKNFEYLGKNKEAFLVTSYKGK